MDYQKTRKCKKCGADIPVDAVYCDICGETVSRRREKKQKRVSARKSGTQNADSKRGTA